jgi:hypothetical protein
VWTKLRQAILDAFGDAEHPKEDHADKAQGYSVLAICAERRYVTPDTMHSGKILTVDQSSGSCHPSLPTSASPTRTQPYLLEVDRIKSPPSTSARVQ